MFDIIGCGADASVYGFSRFYSISDCKGKISECDSLQSAVDHRNRKTLILLRDHAFDEGALRLLGEKKKACLLIDLGRLMRTRGVPRAIAISKLRNLLRLCIKHGVYYSFATFAEKESRIRTPQELEHIAMLFGLNRGQAKNALMMLRHYL